MSLYFPPSLRQFEPRRMVFSTWVDHLPFAYDLVGELRPELVVELGVYNGLSFFTFCQALQEFDIDGVAYGIDCWEGDEHTQGYDDSIYQGVQKHAREHYRGSTYLLKMRFNEALVHFEDSTLDLLHIDGLHTYDAVKEDFDTWFPKVRPGGIVLFHDVMARLGDYGAWRFFEELEKVHDATFKFKHGFGLGVLRKAGGERVDSSLMRMLFEEDPESQKRLRQFYVHAAHFLEARRQAAKFRAAQAGGGTVSKGGQGKQAATA
ncbi:MAG: class I SAM-dependent methyltransferase [Pseudomonadota bacterium]